LRDEAEFLVTANVDRFPDGVDRDTPNLARVYDYLLGGGHNFAVDRQMAEVLMTMLPGTREIARIGRAFLRRVVLFMVSAGVRQFLDIGSGIPTVGNVHEVAQQADPEVRVVYVDIDPVAVTHSKLLREGDSRSVALRADFTEPDGILGHPDVHRLLDFTQPIGLLVLTVLNFVPDDRNPNQLLARYRQALASGSYVALSNVTADTRAPEIAAVRDLVKGTPNQFYPRTREQFTTFFEGLELIEPGIVTFPLWRPESPADVTDGPERDQVLAGVGHKP
jgi:S-adenosyl methyltransferase